MGAKPKIVDRLDAIVAVIGFAAIFVAASFVGVYYEPEKARVLGGVWAAFALICAVLVILLKQPAWAQKSAGSLMVYGWAVSFFHLSLPETHQGNVEWARIQSGMIVDMHWSFHDGWFGIMCASIASCTGLALALWLPNRGSAAASFLLLASVTLFSMAALIQRFG